METVTSDIHVPFREQTALTNNEEANQFDLQEAPKKDVNVSLTHNLCYVQTHMRWFPVQCVPFVSFDPAVLVEVLPVLQGS